MAPTGVTGYKAKATPAAADGVYCGATCPVDGTKITAGELSVNIGVSADYLLAQLDWKLTLATALANNEKVEMFTCFPNASTENICGYERITGSGGTDYVAKTALFTSEDAPVVGHFEDNSSFYLDSGPP